ncbi:unnamed protein product [Thlaspi arvense]|uniref:Protein kinase domain-containing protein n=1 Tax=Thlaspi arvense TaxID=13288 RepID=A0AAU9SS16_THLAR|nr:unnamed protein product [Thlaspi arvense]
MDGKNRLKFKDLYFATEGFKEKGLLGSGGFGSVYKGVMPKTKKEVAVKRVSNKSQQELKEFVSEIVSIGRMSHRNLVPLVGYCLRKDELLLVYDYMPNGSLDKYLHSSPEVTLDWNQRIKVIRGVASALFFLHEDWEQVVIHRDVKASNVLLDVEHNGRLGDFGLARLCGHEVACGRRPLEVQNCENGGERVFLVDWVLGLWNEGDILDAKDPNLGTEIDEREVEMVLKLGLLCSHSDPYTRPTMRQVLHYLRGDAVLPDFLPLDLRGSGRMMLGIHHGLSELSMFTGGSSNVDSILSGGR